MNISSLNKEDFIYNESLQFWKKHVTDDGRREIHLMHDIFFKFLNSNGFYQYQKVNENEFVFVYIYNYRIVKEVDKRHIKAFVLQFLRIFENENKTLLNRIYRISNSFLSDNNFSLLEFIDLEFQKAGPNYQYWFFKNCCWKITENGIEQISYSQLKGYVWEEKIIDFIPKLKTPLFEILIHNGGYYFLPNTEHDCHFLQFLINTSKVHWQKEMRGQLSEQEQREQDEILITKLTQLGYAQHTYRQGNLSYAIIAMDYEESEIGESNGGTGKSIHMKSVEHTTNTVYIPAKRDKLFDDAHLFEQISEKTDFVIFDDVRVNFDFSNLYDFTTGVVTINPKHGRRYSLPPEDVPKGGITTNHAINNNGESDRRRQFYSTFGDYYNKNNTPYDEFGYNLCSNQMPKEQWHLFYNCMARCVQAYFQFKDTFAKKVVGQIWKRTLRQQMGEEYLAWANEYFENPFNLDSEREKKEFYNDFTANLSPKLKGYYCITKFKKCTIAYCDYKGLLLRERKSDGKILWRILSSEAVTK